MVCNEMFWLIKVFL